jgi:signal transduction histidine kinase
MKSSSRASTDAPALLTGILVTTALCWLFSEQFGSFEQVLSHNIFSQTISPTSASRPTSLGFSLMKVGIISGFATAGTIVAYRVSRNLRWIVFVQLIALNLVLHLVQRSVFPASEELLSMPLSLALASSCGLAFGCLVKRYKDERQKVQAQETALETMEKELSTSTLQLIKDDESDRRVLAGDLHDQVLNDLKMLREKLNQLSVVENDSDKQKEMDELILRSMQQIREVMDSLSPAVLQHLGFVDAIEDCVRSGSERGGYKVRFRCNIEHSEFDGFNEIELTLLYRLVQESITNICKHARAKTVKCIITADGGTLSISIIDDGIGIEKSAAETQSRGLKYMQQRASLINAAVIWLPGDDNKGTKVEITITKPK